MPDYVKDARLCGAFNQAEVLDIEFVDIILLILFNIAAIIKPPAIYKVNRTDDIIERILIYNRLSLFFVTRQKICFDSQFYSNIRKPGLNCLDIFHILPKLIKRHSERRICL